MHLKKACSSELESGRAVVEIGREIHIVIVEGVKQYQANLSGAVFVSLRSVLILNSRV